MMFKQWFSPLKGGDNMLTINKANLGNSIMSSQPTYRTLSHTLRVDELCVTPAEMHGLLTGMVCGGLQPQSTEWMPMLYDYTNDSLSWPIESQGMAATYLENTIKALNTKQISFSLLLPEKNEDLLTRAKALTEWVNAFIAGIGLIGVTSNQLTKESNEILKELAEIALLHIDDEEDFNELDTLFQYVLDHVVDCVLTLHLHLNEQNQETTPQDIHSKPTLH